MEQKPIQKKQVLAWAEKWMPIMTKPNVSYYVLDDSKYYDEAKNAGLKFDNGVSFINVYPVNSYEEALNVLPKVTDPQVLGNLIVSRMVDIYKSEGYASIDTEWFKKTFTKLIELCK